MNCKRMQGVYVVEFAVIGLVLFMLLFGVLELGRLYFTVNVMEEVVRRGARLAAVCDIHDPWILRRAIFNNKETDTGSSSLIASLETSNLKLDYFDKHGIRVPAPDDLTSDSGFRAIRFVRLRIEKFPFNLLIPGFEGAITLPVFESTLPRESLGRHPEDTDRTPCEPPKEQP